MASVRPWLPTGALNDGALATAVRETGSAWASRWFVEQRALSEKLTPIKERTKIRGDHCTWAIGTDLTFSIDQASLQKVALSMLSLPLPRGQTLKPRDIDTLASVARSAIVDLATSVGTLFQIGASPSLSGARDIERGGIKITITAGGNGPTFDIYASEAATTTARKALTKRSKTHTRLSSIHSGLSKQNVSVGARLGESKMSLPELANLALGDIVVIDRGPEDQFELTINGQIRSQALCELVRDAERPQLRIRAFPDVSPA